MKLYRGKFIEWLKTKPPEEIVGENRSTYGCPIANFYHEASGGDGVSIFDDGWGNHIIDRGYSRKPLPGWAEDFVFLVDGESDRKISARRALEVVRA